MIKLTIALTIILFVVVALGSFNEQKQIHLDVDTSYWNDYLRVIRLNGGTIYADDSLIAMFAAAPECFQFETMSTGFPLIKLGGTKRYIDEYGRGWLIECVTNWDAIAKIMKNGQTSKEHIFPQETKSTLIFAKAMEKK